MFQKKFCAAMVVVFCLCMAGSLFAEEKKSITNSIGMRFVYIPPGTFMMGSPENEPNRDKDETLHKVTLTKGFYMQTTEVTQGQWKAIMGKNPSKFYDCGDNCPVEQVSWDDAQTFIRKLNENEGTSKYRLPTEAEWEYAARAGTTTAYSFGDDKNQLGQYAWYEDNSGKKSHPVGQLKPNPWGLYDIHGNVMEWCHDAYGDTYYANSPSTDPKGASSGSERAMRGCSWIASASLCTSANRDNGRPNHHFSIVGLRLVRSE